MFSGAERGTRMAPCDLDVAGVRWRFAQRTGVPGDPRLPLVLCNGIGANWEVLQPLLDALGDHPAVAFDVPGTGASSMPRAPYALPTLARQLAEALGALGIGRFDLLGVSWGGALAQQLALQEGTRCRRLVLAATTPGWGALPGQLSALAQLASGRRLADPRHAQQVLPAVYGGRVADDPSLLAGYLRSLRPPRRAGYALQLSAVAGWSSLWWLPLLGQRTLLLAGTRDPLIPVANAHLMRRLLRAGELQLIDDGHLFLHTQAAALGPRIAGFLGA